ncbi:metallophosphoesterase [Methanonatronarchaeum sp. AMET6-2]|nr:metallophosphoesterase [Methanonatronarchaeum sp. AMET6-2]
MEDIKNINTDFAVVLGDIVHDDLESVPQFVDAMNGLGHNWSYVLGNHDFDRETREPVLDVNYFSEVFNGIRVIGLSDEDGDRTHTGVIGDEQDQWLRETLDSDPDKPTVIMTHHCPVDRSVTSFDDWLKDDIDEYNIVLWLSGHAHKWDYDEDINGLGFDRLKITSIYHWGWWFADEQQSLLFSVEQIEENRSTITMEFRDHAEGEWLRTSDVTGIHVPTLIAVILTLGLAGSLSYILLR